MSVMLNDRPSGTQEIGFGRHGRFQAAEVRALPSQGRGRRGYCQAEVFTAMRQINATARPDVPIFTSMATDGGDIQHIARLMIRHYGEHTRR